MIRSTKLYVMLRKLIKNNIIASRIQYNKEKKATEKLPIAYRNWWTSNPQQLETDWFLPFFRNRLNIQNQHPVISIFAAFGRKKNIQWVKQEGIPIIFFTGENLYSDNLIDRKEYQDHCLNEVDLALGFAEIDHKNYLRLPLWYYDLPADANLKTMQAKLDEMQKKRQQEKTNFCALVSNHDINGLRTRLFNLLNPIAPIDSAGRLLNNTNTLKVDYNDNKFLFLEHYMFNICPENSNSPGYVTEKIFDAIVSGTLPIYWGSNNNPEPDLLNHDAILLCNEHDLPALYNKVNELYGNKTYYKEFMAQPIFLPHAAECIIDKLNTLEARINALIKNI